VPTVSPFEANHGEAVITSKNDKPAAMVSNESSVTSSVSVKSKKSGRILKKQLSNKLRLILKKIKK
jgi:hypothetical protein